MGVKGSKGTIGPANVRTFTRNYEEFEWVGHKPTTPWWATPLGIGLALLIFLLLILLGHP